LIAARLCRHDPAAARQSLREGLALADWMQLPPRHYLRALLLALARLEKTTASPQLRTAVPPPRWTPWAANCRTPAPAAAGAGAGRVAPEVLTRPYRLQRCSRRAMSQYLPLRRSPLCTA